MDLGRTFVLLRGRALIAGVAGGVLPFVLLAQKLEVVQIVMKRGEHAFDRMRRCCLQGGADFIPALSNLKDDGADLRVEVILYLVVASILSYSISLPVFKFLCEHGPLVAIALVEHDELRLVGLGPDLAFEVALGQAFEVLWFFGLYNGE